MISLRERTHTFTCIVALARATQYDDKTHDIASIYGTDVLLELGFDIAQLRRARRGLVLHVALQLRHFLRQLQLLPGECV